MRAKALLGALGASLLFSVPAVASQGDETLEPAPAPAAAPAPTYTYAPPPAPAPTYAPPPYYYPPPGYYYGYPPPPPPRAKRTWYGWQTLATDGTAFLMIYAAAQSRSGDGAGLAYGSLAMYNLGAPLVHFAHRNFGRGLGSLAVRSLPSILVFGEPRDRDYTLALLTLVSVPTMIALDAALLAREDEEEPPMPRSGMKVAPTATATQSGGMLGVAGLF